MIKNNVLKLDNKVYSITRASISKYFIKKKLFFDEYWDIQIKMDKAYLKIRDLPLLDMKLPSQLANSTYQISSSSLQLAYQEIYIPDTDFDNLQQLTINFNDWEAGKHYLNTGGQGFIETDIPPFTQCYFEFKGDLFFNGIYFFGFEEDEIFQKYPSYKGCLMQKTMQEGDAYYKITSIPKAQA